MWPLTLLESRSERYTPGPGEDIPLQQFQATQTSVSCIANARQFQTPRRSAAAYLLGPEGRISEQRLAKTRRSMDVAKDDVLLTLARRSAHVTQQLQKLLDAQSDGLMRGLGREPAGQAASQQVSGQYLSPNGREHATSGDGDAIPHNVRDSVYRDDPLRSSSVSPVRSRLSPSISQSTHTLSPSRRQKVVPVRQPAPPKPLSLREARVGIAENLRALASLKTEEADVYSGRVQRGSEGLAKIQNLTEQDRGLKSEISKREAGIPEEEEELHRQEIELDGEIRGLEERLSELRAQLRDVKRTRTERENTRAAEVSSFRNALDDLSRTVRRDVLSDRSEYRRPKAKTGRDKDGVWGLPEDRRTLDLVKEDIEAQIVDAEQHQKAAVDEGAVCEEGAHIWQSINERMDTLEKRLSQEIKKLNTRPNSSLSNATSSDETNKTPTNSVHPSEPAGEGMHGVMELMDSTIHSLQADLNNVEEKGWTLLVCCIGAELEALKEAQELLSDTLVHSRMLPPRSADLSKNGRSGPKSEGSGLTASMYTAEESGSAHTANVLHDELVHNGEDEDEDVSDPQALFGTHEPEAEREDHQLQGPELLISHE